jgi:2Fe-2S ferredoxin
MARVIFIQSDGAERPVDAPEGASLMSAAVANGVSGILADCDGGCSCGTCHVHVDPAWQARVGGRSTLEHAVLEYSEELQEGSRLSCQITVSPDLDGLIVRIPETQG